MRAAALLAVVALALCAAATAAAHSKDPTQRHTVADTKRAKALALRLFAGDVELEGLVRECTADDLAEELWVEFPAFISLEHASGLFDALTRWRRANPACRVAF